jgi:ferredoxin
MPFKRCTRCGKLKDEKEFNWRYKGKMRQSICRDCQKIARREHYERHREEEIARSIAITREQRDKAQRFIYDYLSHHKCVDCGEYDFSVLTFDHVIGKKKMAISSMVNAGYSIEAIMNEISKCEVVCFNCHMRRENKRRSGGRFRRFWPKFPWEK